MSLGILDFTDLHLDLFYKKITTREFYELSSHFLLHIFYRLQVVLFNRSLSTSLLNEISHHHIQLLILGFMKRDLSQQFSRNEFEEVVLNNITYQLEYNVN